MCYNIICNFTLMTMVGNNKFHSPLNTFRVKSQLIYKSCVYESENMDRIGPLANNLNTKSYIEKYIKLQMPHDNLGKL